MTDKTLSIMHNAYEKSIRDSSSIVGTVRRLKESLEVPRSDIPLEDLPAFYTFLDGLEACYHFRKNTTDLTVLVTYLSITILGIVSWMSSQQEDPLYVDVFARRKSLESDLTKMLIKSVSNPDVSASNGDFMGVRVVLLNTSNSPEDAMESLTAIEKMVNQILGGQNRLLREAFIDWYAQNGSKISFPSVQTALSIPFSIDKVEVFKKKNGYKAIHVDLTTQSYTPYDCLKGVPIEIQYQTWHDYLVAKSGTASHSKYKSEIDKKLNTVFCLSDYSSTQIPGLSNDMDLDGIKKENDEGKVVCGRRTQMYD